MIDRGPRLWRRFVALPLDWPALGAALGLMGIGLLTVYSGTSIPGSHEGLWLRQLAWAGIAIALATLAASVHFRIYDSLAYPIYGLSLIFLVLVLFFGSSAYGAKRWLDLGPIKFQPSELAKIAMVFAVARRLDDPKLDLRRFGHWFPPLILMLVPFLLVAKEPDLGTSLAFPIMLVAMYYWAGMPTGQLLLGLSPVFNVALYFVTGSLFWFLGLFAVLLGVFRPRLPVLLTIVLVNGAVAVALPRIWDGLHDYQKRRIETFLNPGRDPHGSGYQIIQSKVAIGSGGVTGRGYLKGTQKALAFLPMRHTDFIFSVVGEELGLLGAMSVVVLYALLLLRGYSIALRCRQGFGSLIAVGLVTALFYHVMVNILMTIGWAPVTGLPLPLLSYGGTALIVNGIQIGVLQGLALRHREG